MRKGFTKNILLIWQNAEIILIILFFAIFSFNIRKVFLTPYSFLNGQFNEYLTPNLSLSDLLAFLAIFIIAIKHAYCQLYLRRLNYTLSGHNYRLLSINNLPYYFSRETFLITAFFSWIALSIFWSPFKQIAIYRTVLILGLFIYFLVVYFSAKKSLYLKKWLKMAILFSAAIQAIIAIFQFVRNSSLGFTALGESILGPGIPGVAKIAIYGVKHIRSYGTFGHPNILAGFLLIPMFLIVDKVTDYFVDDHRSKTNVSRENISVGKRYVFTHITLFFVIFIAFILTFSREAYISFFIGLVILFTVKFGSIFAISKARIISAFFILFAIAFLVVSRIYPSVFLSTQSLEERKIYLDISRETISSHPLTGVGIGQFVFNEFVKHPTLQSWQYQPVHNFLLLITSELGIIGLALFLLFILGLLWRRVRSTKSIGLTRLSYYCIIIGFLFISMFDHYFWDLKQGLIIFFIPFVLFLIESDDLTYYDI